MSPGITELLRRLFHTGHGAASGGYEENLLRPPGAVTEARFMALCIRCSRCIEVCPYGSIKRAGFGSAIGTPYVRAEVKACYLCMACCGLCPTAALDPTLVNPEMVRMGKARIEATLCYSHLFMEHDVLPKNAGGKIGALCNTCYNVCPLPDKAIKLERNLFPVIMEGCVGCGICVERCPVRPKRAINVAPTGMGLVDEAGYHFRKARKQHDGSGGIEGGKPGKVLKGEELLDRKYKIDGSGDFPKKAD
ncbi:MAG: 4Fe-4S dicluster domain-containing protein [Pseudomonadota bacterium]